MQTNIGIKKIGLYVSVILSTVFLLVMSASLVLVGTATNGSLSATMLALDWRTVVGFELVFLGSLAISLIIAAIGILAYRSTLYILKTRPIFHKTENISGNISIISTRSFKYLSVIFVLPILAFLILHTLSLFIPAEIAHGAAHLKASDDSVVTHPLDMGSAINSLYREAEPSYTADGHTMYFNCNNSDICVSHLTGSWEAGNWSTPIRLGSAINTEYEEIEPIINGAGDQLYFTSIRPIGILNNVPFLSALVDISRLLNIIAINKTGHTILGGFGMDDIYVSNRINDVWTKPQNINDVPGEPPINTSYADHCLFFSADGKEAFWTSTRPGGYGSDDIWTSKLVDGKWTNPENLGPNVNGVGSEHSPIPTPDGKSLYVTSDRPGGFGGEDIYITTRNTNGTWGTLVNLGSAINGPGDDRCAAWTPDLKIFLFDSTRSGGFGGRDIWWIYYLEVQ
jgi:hypothetical protein